MESVKKQKFDFDAESNQKEFENWKNALSNIPIEYWVEEPDHNDEEYGTVAIKVTYQYYDGGDNVWFWFTFQFLKDGTVNVVFTQNWLDDEPELYPVVNKMLQDMCLGEVDKSLDIWPEKKFATWQEGYNFLCEIARKKRIPPVSVQTNF